MEAAPFRNPPLLRDRGAWGLGALYVVFLLFLCPLRGLQLDAHDEGGKYAFLPSAFLDGDLDFVNQRKGYNLAYKVTPTGYSLHQWGIGPAVLWSPFFALGHALAVVAAPRDYPYPLDGYCFPYFLSVSLGSLCYGWAGLLLLYDLLRRLYGRAAGGLASAVLFFSSSIPYHLFVRPIHDHALAFSGVSLVLWSFHRLREDAGRKTSWGLLGAATGLTMTIRPDTPLVLLSVCVAVLPLLFGAVRERRLAGPCLWLTGTLLFYLPQALANRIFWGAWIGSGGDTFHSVNDFARSLHVGILAEPQRWRDLLLNPVGGLLLQSPFSVLVLPGLLLSIRRDPFASLGWMLYPLLLMTAVLALTDDRHLLQADGRRQNSWLLCRYLGDGAPILAMGMAEILSRLGGRRAPAFRLVAVLGSLAIAWQALQCQRVENPAPTNEPDFLARTLSGFPSALEAGGLGAFCRPGSLVRVFLVDPSAGAAGWILLLAVLGLLAWMAAWPSILDGLRRRDQDSPSGADRRLRILLGAAVLALLPVLGFELCQPRKSEREVYEATLLRLRLSLKDPWPAWDRELLSKARERGERLGEDPRPLLPVEGWVRFREGDVEGAQRIWLRTIEDGENRLALKGLSEIAERGGDRFLRDAYRKRAAEAPPDPNDLP